MHEILFFEDEHTYLVDGEEKPSVTTILRYITDIEYKEISAEILRSAARRGSAVHEYTELIDYGAEPDEIDGEIIPYIQAYKSFLRDYKPKWKNIETPVYSKTYGFVGTLDRAGIIDGEECVLDIKTTSAPSKVAKLAVCCQTYAYKIARYETLGIQSKNRYALYLDKDGDYTLFNCKEYEQKYDFNSGNIVNECVHFYKLMNNIKEMKVAKGKKNE